VPFGDWSCVSRRFDNPEMDRERAELRRTKGRYQAALREIEQGILEGIASKDAVAILESPMVYTMLSQAQNASADLKAKLERVNYMQQRILDMREVYVKGVAAMASVLYFMLADLSTVNHAYRFSLKWFSEVDLPGLFRAMAISEDYLYNCSGIVLISVEMLWADLQPGACTMPTLQHSERADGVSASRVYGTTVQPNVPVFV
jgi:hypothetical protein